VESIEAHVEHLLGQRVVDVDGRHVGRLEEMLAEIVDGETVVTEFHIGSAALVERIASFLVQLPFFRRIPLTRHGYRVGWQQFDLSNSRVLRVNVRRDQLSPIELGGSSAKR